MTRTEKTSIYQDRLDGLHDTEARIRIETRVRRLEAGNPGDARALGGGVQELRVHHGPGYRVYFIRTRAETALLLTGGDKRHHWRDIERARRMKRELEEAENGEDQGH